MLLCHLLTLEIGSKPRKLLIRLLFLLMLYALYPVKYETSYRLQRILQFLDQLRDSDGSNKQKERFQNFFLIETCNINRYHVGTQEFETWDTLL